MPSMEGIFEVKSRSGIKLDGTKFESDYYSDGLWCRFQRGKPRKIGGYRNISSNFSKMIRGSFVDSRNANMFVYGGSSDFLEMAVIDKTGGGGGISNRTPAGFAINDNNIWQFDKLYDAGGTVNRIIAHAGQNLSAIDSSTQTPIYYGDANASAALLNIGTSVSGGIFCLHPYLLALDNDGYVQWTPPNTMSFAGAGSGNARIAQSKLIKGVKTRGGSGASPSGLIWSLDELYRVTFTGGSTVFSFDYIGDTSLASSAAVVEYNGTYFWPDLCGFKVFNGVIQDMPNDMVQNYFFDRQNSRQHQKIWGMKVPRYNEIWWFWPKDDAIECTDIIIYNVKENTWYTSEWPDFGSCRSSGVYSKAWDYPLMFDTQTNTAGKKTLWQHEFGVDRVEGSTALAIKSYFETANVSYCANLVGEDWVGVDKWVQLMRIEPDFVQSGDMNLYVKGKPYATGEVTESAAYPFSPTTTKIDLKEQRRQMTLKFESNVAGGDYQLGQTMMHVQIGDGRQ